MTINFDISDETRQLLADVRDWSVNTLRPLARQADTEQYYPRDKQWCVQTCPVDVSPLAYPGLPLDDPLFRDKKWTASLREDGSSLVGVMVMEEMNYGDGWGWQQLAGSGVGEVVIGILGDEAQVKKWVNGVYEGTYGLTGWGSTEQGAGADVMGVEATATKDGDGWRLNGVKRFISNGAHCDYIVFFGSIDRNLPGKGLRAFIVEKGTPGFTVETEKEDKLGLRYTPQAKLRFDDVWVPDENMLRGQNDGAGTLRALATFNRTRPYCCAWGVGIAQGSLDYVRDHLRADKASFAPHRWSRVEETLDGLNYALHQQRRLMWRACWTFDQGLPDAKVASQAKASIPSVCEQVVLRSMQLMGPEAASEEHLLEKWYRDVKLMDLVEGPPQIQKITVSRQMFGSQAARG
jgi:alkylation response protein AidB-like acyl-CoA dehydrogenase